MIEIITPATRLHHFRFRTYKLFSPCFLLSRVHVNVFRNKRVSVCSSRVTRSSWEVHVLAQCVLWLSSEPPPASCVTATAATLNWICMTECRRDDLPLLQHPLRRAICPHNTSNKLFSTILSSPLLHTYRQSTLRWLYQTVLSLTALYGSIYLPHSR